MAVFLALSTYYSLVTPTFEAPDEPAHTEYALYLASFRRLPLIPGFFEALQPPLYYALGAAYLTAAGWGGEEAYYINPPSLPRNPHFIWQGGRDLRLYLHGAEEFFPYLGTAQVVHLLRLLNVLLGGGTVVLVYLLALEVRRGDLHLAALSAGVVALLPEFNSVSASVTNESLVAFLAALVFLCCAKLLCSHPKRRELLIFGLGAASGLLLATKLSAFFVLPAAVAAVLVSAEEARARLRGLALAVAGLVATSGWYFARNLAVYGDPLALAAQGEHLSRYGVLTPRPISYLFDRFLGAFHQSLWGLFGMVSIPLPDSFYPIYDGLALLALVGLVVAFLRRRASAKELLLIAMMAGTLLVLFASIAQCSLVFCQAPPGRYFMGGIAAFAFILGYGLLRLGVLARLRPAYLVWPVLLGLLALNGYTAARQVAPVYAQPYPQAAGYFFVGEIADGVEQGQVFVASDDGLSGIEVLLEVYGRRNSRPIFLHLKESPDSSEELAVAQADVSGMRRGDWVLFSFAPIANSRGRTFYFYLASPSSTNGNAATAIYDHLARDETERRIVNGRVYPGRLLFRLHYAAEAAAGS